MRLELRFQKSFQVFLRTAVTLSPNFSFQIENFNHLCLFSGTNGKNETYVSDYKFTNVLKHDASERWESGHVGHASVMWQRADICNRLVPQSLANWTCWNSIVSTRPSRLHPTTCNHGSSKKSKKLDGDFKFVIILHTPEQNLLLSLSSGLTSSNELFSNYIFRHDCFF